MLRRLVNRVRGSLAEQTREPAASIVDWPSWLASRQPSGLYVDIPAAPLALLRERYPDRVEATRARAERLLAHEFDLLGSGPFVPVDPTRPARGNYRPIDWYLDPVQHLRFPQGVPHRDWKLYEMRPGNADVKLPWELARCQHWVTLGQAFRLTRDERFATEIANELDDFVEANPVGIGINWTCTMDVGLRAVSWALGLELVKTSALAAAFRQRAYAALFDHGRFIRANLENTYEVTSNHFLSNVVGLWFLGAVFGDMPEGGAWQAFAREALEHELDVQVLPDGADFESSVPYHRFVTELFLASARLGQTIGAPLSPRYCARVKEMVAYLAGVLRPDGLMPQIGDADDGRLHIFSGYASTSPQDPRHLFAPAASMFDERSWRGLAGEVGDWEAAWWGFDLSIEPASRTKDPRTSQLFPDAGVAVMRGDDGHYLVVTNGVVGTKGFGNHKHNDQLSFEYHSGGTPFVVDPGSFVYTSDPAARNRFRGTASHNTLSIDGVEQNELNPEWLFRLFESSNAEHVAFVDDGDRVEYAGRHHGYERLPEAVTHERVVTMQKTSGAVKVRDRVLGRGPHELTWHFHLAPGVHADDEGGGNVLLVSGSRRVRLRLPSDLRVEVTPAEYSPSYGVKRPCLAVDASMRASLDGERVWVFEIERS
jgi:uncharacterized heparinase superfamily protein